MASRRTGRADPAARHPRGARRPARRAGGGAVRLPHHLPGAHGPYDARLARAAAAGEPWGPLAEAYLARRFGEVFGEGSASYVEVRDEFSADEFSAWLAYFLEWDRLAGERKAAADHAAAMKVARDARSEEHTS